MQVDLVGAAVRVDDEGNALPSLPKRPAFASGEIKLGIEPSARRLSVTATPREKVLEPGAETLVEVEVKDAQGRSVAGTDTAVIVVDESVLALTNYKLADPLSIFYAERNEDVTDYHLRERVKLADPAQVKQLAEANQFGVGQGEGGASAVSAKRVMELPINGRGFMSSVAEMVNVSSDASGASQAQITLRQNFNALAVFAASLPTDANGHAQVKVKLPDNLTRYRVMAVSVAGGKLAGFGESAITARKALMARPSAPRFLNYGDVAELPVVLQNQTNQAMTVTAAVQLCSPANCRSLIGMPTWAMTVFMKDDAKGILFDSTVFSSQRDVINVGTRLEVTRDVWDRLEWPIRAVALEDNHGCRYG